MVPRVDQNRYRSRKGGLAQNVLAICDFDMNFTYVYAGWEGSAADARVLDHAVSHDNTFPFPPIGKYYLVDAGFTNYQIFPRSLSWNETWHIADIWRALDLHWTLNVEQRFMWMIVDDNTRAPMRDDALAKVQMGHWARGLHRHFGYPYTHDQYYPLASRYYQYPEPHYPSMLETHTHIASWDAVEHVARGDGGPQIAHSTSLAARRSLDMGSEVGGIGSWTDYIRHFGVQSDRGAQTNSDGDSTARSRRPQGLPPRPRDGP
ncbi:UNVERIFIED_CONTAM: hypothetical protein Sangu_2645400 [Sesamum angustifolium]|uniref:DDE Tnp4 domain-containing protein n=1 Tax=Sesamum angustifolium TaxID=2727405 RepID=A0AAW2J3Z9_9LAMI